MPSWRGRLNSSLFVKPPRAGARSRPTGPKARSASFYSDGTSVRAEKTFVFTGGVLRHDDRASGSGRTASRSPRPSSGGPASAIPPPPKPSRAISATRGSAVYTGGKVFRMNEKKYQARREHLQLRRLGRLRGELFRRPLRLAARRRGRRPSSARPARPPGVRSRPISSMRTEPTRSLSSGPRTSTPSRPSAAMRRRSSTYGFFGMPVAEILLVVVKFCHKLVPNWGVIDHPSDHDHQDHLLPADLQLDEIDGQDGRPAAEDQGPAGQVQEGQDRHRAAPPDERRDDEALQGERRQPGRRLPAAAHPAAGLRGASSGCSSSPSSSVMPLSPCGSRTCPTKDPFYRDTRADGHHPVHLPEDDADLGRSRPRPR